MTAPARAAVAGRALAFAALWLVLMPGAGAGDLAFGAFAVACATWTSVRLLPPSRRNVRVGRLLRHVPRLFVASILAGVDVARRALALRPHWRPGLVRHPTALPPGLARTTFATVTSLLPGTVPAGETGDAIDYHALDTSQPVADALAVEERRLAAALAPGDAP